MLLMQSSQTTPTQQKISSGITKDDEDAENPTSYPRQVNGCEQ
jgi:hypothetical protein